MVNESVYVSKERSETHCHCSERSAYSTKLGSFVTQMFSTKQNTIQAKIVLIHCNKTCFHALGFMSCRNCLKTFSFKTMLTLSVSSYSKTKICTLFMLKQQDYRCTDINIDPVQRRGSSTQVIFLPSWNPPNRIKTLYTLLKFKPSAIVAVLLRSIFTIRNVIPIIESTKLSK